MTLSVADEFHITNTTPSSTHIQVEWAYPTEDERNVYIFSALSEYQGPCHADSTHEREWTTDPTQRAVTIRDLKPFSDYNVIVKMIYNTTRTMRSTSAVTVSTLPSGKQ